MAVDKLVDSEKLDADLTSVANAIRGQTNTTGDLSFPDGFVSSINSIDKSLGLTGATVGQIAKITAVDGNGVPTAWETTEKSRRIVLQDVVNIGSKHINVVSIDYENGVLELEPNSEPFTNDYNTTLYVFPAMNHSTAKNTGYKYQYMPPEMYYNQYNPKGVLVGENRIKIYFSSGNPISSFTDTGEIDLSSWQICVVPNSTRIHDVSVTGLKHDKCYEVEAAFPDGLLQGAGGIWLNGILREWPFYETFSVSLKNLTTPIANAVQPYGQISVGSINTFMFPWHLRITIRFLSDDTLHVTMTKTSPEFANINGTGWSDKYLKYQSNTYASIVPITGDVSIRSSYAGNGFVAANGTRLTVWEVD